MNEPRYDVIIVHTESGLVESIAGQNMPLESGSFHTAEKRLDTVSPRLNHDYHARIVLTGQAEKGKPAPAWYHESQPLYS